MGLMETCDFSGWATRNDLLCSDGRTIRKHAFSGQDGAEVPLIWNHNHNDPTAYLGHAVLEDREEGVYAYGFFDDTDRGQLAKQIVHSGKMKSLSIWANQLKQIGGDVIKGHIRELSLVYAGANPGAYIESVLAHSDDAEEGEALKICYDENLIICHSGDKKDDPEKKEEPEKKDDESGKTVGEIIDAMTEEQQEAVAAVVGAAVKKALDEAEKDDEKEEVKHSDTSEGGDNNMGYNVFENEGAKNTNVLSHADQQAIMALAKQSNVGSLKTAMQMYAEEHAMMHADGDGAAVGVFENAGLLFPELELLKKGEPETIWPTNNDWVETALNKIHKSPFSRIRTRFADARLAELQSLRAKGYQKPGDEKKVMGQIKMINRETTPQTIYIKSSMHRDDEIDITDFSYAAYQWNIMYRMLKETLILAAMVGDGRDDVDPDKIHEENIRPIWKDDDEYTIHYDVDIEAARKTLQGTNTGANFSDNYIYAEALIMAALYSREKFKGSGTPDFYCDPHLVNVMLLARDLNGRRIYESKAELARALNANSIIEVEHFAGLTRTDDKGKVKKLLGLFVNLNDYTFGSTKGGEITKFENFDIDFNLKKFLLETRLSGSLYKLKSAIALEEPVADGTEG